MQTVTATQTVNVILRALRADIAGYSAVIANAILSNRLSISAKDLRDELCEAAAQAQHGAAYESMTFDQKAEAQKFYQSRFKKYTEKGLKIANVAAERGLPLDQIHTLTQAKATDAVTAWLTGPVIGASDVQTLWEKFGFASERKSREAKPDDATPPAAPDAPEGNDEPEALPDVAPVNGTAQLIALFQTQLSQLSDDDKRTVAAALLPMLHKYAEPVAA